MIQSKLMPILIKVSRLRLGYKWRGMRLGAFYHVIGYDTERLVVTGETADRAYVVRWRDVELVKSEVTVAQSRPNTALLSETQLLRRAMGKLTAAIPKLRGERRPETPMPPRM